MNTFMQIEQASVEAQQENTYEAGYDAAMADAAAETLMSDFDRYYGALQMMSVGNLSDGAVEALSVALGAPVEAVSSLAAIEEDGILKKMKDAVVNFIKGIIEWIKGLFGEGRVKARVEAINAVKEKLVETNGVADLEVKLHNEEDSKKKAKIEEEIQRRKQIYWWLTLDHERFIYAPLGTGDTIKTVDRESGTETETKIGASDQLDTNKFNKTCDYVTNLIKNGKEYIATSKENLKKAKDAGSKEDIEAAKVDVKTIVRKIKDASVIEKAILKLAK